MLNWNWFKKKKHHFPVPSPYLLQRKSSWSSMKYDESFIGIYSLFYDRLWWMFTVFLWISRTSCWFWRSEALTSLYDFLLQKCYFGMSSILLHYPEFLNKCFLRGWKETNLRYYLEKDISFPVPTYYLSTLPFSSSPTFVISLRLYSTSHATISPICCPKTALSVKSIPPFSSWSPPFSFHVCVVHQCIVCVHLAFK